MRKDYIYKIPMLKSDNICKICGKKVNREAEVLIRKYINSRGSYGLVTCKVVVCDSCGLPYMNGRISNEITRNINKLPVDIFFLTNTEELKEIKKQVFNDGMLVEIVDKKSLWKPILNISSMFINDKCASCGENLKKEYTLIPISKEKYVKVVGMYCYKCRTLYVENEDFVKFILMDNIYAQKFSFNKDNLSNYTKRKRSEKRKKEKEKMFHNKLNLLRSIDSSIEMISIKIDSKEVDNIIVGNIDNENKKRHIYHYTSVEARELLSAVHIASRKRRGNIFQKNFEIISKPIYREVINDTRIRPSELTLGVDGGYSSSVRNNQSEIVDLMLYSPFTKRYELIKATHRMYDDLYYVDFSLYRDFVRKYGNSQIVLNFESNGTGYKRWDELNDESVLKICGYSTDKRDGLSTKDRQEILADIIDLNICTVSQIINYLNFFISSHPSDGWFPNRVKWQEDIEFVKKYNVNTNRFMVVSENQ